MAENPVMDTAALITLVRRASALAALREQPLDRRDLEECLGVSKPTVHRLTRTLGEMSLVEKSNGIFVLTGLGEAVADVVVEFTRNVETAYRLAPLLETFRHQYPALDVTGFADATVTTAGPGDPYRPMRRYYSFIEETETLCGFDTTTLSPEYIDAVHQQIRDGMETELIYPPAVITQFLSVHPEQMAESVENGHLVLRVHPNLPHGLAIFDERVAIVSYCETTGALRTFIDTDSSTAREWAEEVYVEYRAEATEFAEYPELSRLPLIQALNDTKPMS
jgi:predicted transcriptional regulator